MGWLRSSQWDIEAKKDSVLEKHFAKLQDANSARIIWNNTAMAVDRALHASGYKHHQPATGWTYKVPAGTNPEAVGYIYEEERADFESVHWQTTAQHAVFASLEMKTAITDAERHYICLRDIGTGVHTETASSSSPHSAVSSSSETSESSIEQRMMQRMAQMEAILAAAEQRLATQAAEIQALKDAQANSAPFQATQVDALATHAMKAKDTLSRLHPDAILPSGDGPMVLTTHDAAKGTAKFQVFTANLAQIGATLGVLQDEQQTQSDRLDKVEGTVESVQSKMRRQPPSMVTPFNLFPAASPLIQPAGTSYQPS